MQKKLEVHEFDKKQDLVDYVNKHSDNLEIVTISSSQASVSYRHFLWYYEK